MDYKYWVMERPVEGSDGYACFCPLEVDEEGRVLAVLDGLNIVSTFAAFMKVHDPDGVVMVDNISSFSNPERVA